MGLIGRFSGVDGERHISAALKRQKTLIHCESALSDLAKAGEIVPFAPGAEVLRQDADDNDMVFLIAGTVEVFVNGKSVGLRHQDEHVGEMSMLDPREKRSATVIAQTEVIALRVPEPAFERVAEKHPQLWRCIAVEIADRLRRRGSMIPIPNARPLIFIGSSSEALPVVNELTPLLDPSSHDVKPWTEGVFGLSATSIESLEQTARKADLAIILLTCDDKAVVRRRQRQQPRDNTIFELGLFIGAIGRERVIMLHEDGAALPSDLAGISVCVFSRDPDAEDRKRLPRVAGKILARIRELNVK